MPSTDNNTIIGPVFGIHYSNSCHDNESQDETTDLPGEVQSIASEMTAFLEQAKYAGSLKEEILFGTQQIIKKYPAMKDSSYQEGLNKLLAFEAKTKCAVHLSHEELRQVWLS